MRIGVLSDTHVPRRAAVLPLEVLRGLEGVDLILHAGDLVDERVLRVLEMIAPVEAVAGNMDPPGLLTLLGDKKLLALEGFNIGLIHGRGDAAAALAMAGAAFPGADCVVFGHSHRPYNRWHGSCLFFNPGSPTDNRFEPRPSYGVLYLAERVEGEIIFF